jgi:hypothetical protein
MGQPLIKANSPKKIQLIPIRDDYANCAGEYVLINRTHYANF